MSNNLALFIGWLKDNNIDFEYVSTSDSDTLKIYDYNSVYYPDILSRLITEYSMCATREHWGIKFYGTRGKHFEILFIRKENADETLYGY